MMQNAYLLAKIGTDTADNEPDFAKILANFGNPIQCLKLGEDQHRARKPQQGLSFAYG